MYATQRCQIYFPTQETHNHAVESFFLPVTGAKLKIWSLHKEREAAIIYFGGNAEDVAGDLAGFAQLFPDYAIYLVNYRSYGGSTGKPSETALLNDALTIFDFLADNHPHISVIGRSLGSAVAVRLGRFVYEFRAAANVAEGMGGVGLQPDQCHVGPHGAIGDTCGP